MIVPFVTLCDLYSEYATNVGEEGGMRLLSATRLATSADFAYEDDTLYSTLECRYGLLVLLVKAIEKPQQDVELRKALIV
jgi:hypothetical protein